MIPFLAVAASVCYAAAAYAALRIEDARAHAALAALALAAHAGALALLLFSAGGLLLGITEMLSLVAGQSALLFWIVCLRERVLVLAAPLYAVVAAAALAAALWPLSVSATPVADTRLQLHVLLSVLAAGMLTLSALQAAALALQDRLLHRGRSAPLVERLPPLQTMERLLFRSIAFGFVLLSCALATGALFVDDMLAQHLAHKTVLSVAAWVIFGLLLLGRYRSGWRGRRAVQWTLSGYAVLILAYFGSKFVLEHLLDTHWG